MSKVYVIVIKDRHADVDVEVFADKDKAVERARSIAKEYCRLPDDYEERQIDGRVFRAVYSCESDSVTVHEREAQ